MYVTDENIETLRELRAFVDGALESADDEEYWQDLASRTSDLFRKAIKQRDRQDFQKDVRKALTKLRKQKRE
jgi:broad specificity phosphatase PhoE